ncbi:hypothetical protein IKW73_02600 [Candidatus Saccharibacteria bacterium]|nr:hypothetical protein [Candidatus Saccharibacteria bacterium]
MESLFKLVVQDTDVVVPDTGMYTRGIADGGAINLGGIIFAGFCLLLMVSVVVLRIIQRKKATKKACTGLLATVVAGAAISALLISNTSAVMKSLDITVSDTITATIDRSKGESSVVVPVDITLNEASADGYDLYIYGGALTDGTNTIEQVSSDGVEITSGTWGIIANNSETAPEIDATEWGQTGTASAPKKVYTVDTAAAAGSTFRVYYGVSVDEDTPAGVYTTTIGFAMKHEVALTLEESYEFSEKEKVPVGPDEYYTIQDMDSTICENTDVIPSEMQVVDVRDNRIYTIGKLADGHCWLLDNLALDPTDATVAADMNSTNTNATDEAINNFINGSATALHDGWSTSPVGRTYMAGGVDYMTPRLFDQSKDITSADLSDPDEPLAEAANWKFGIYYNYCAVSAGTYCYTDGDSSIAYDKPDTAFDIDYDICPAGWRLPSGGNGGEYEILYNTYYDANESNPSHPFRKALHLPISGYVSYIGPVSQGSYVSYWTATNPGNDGYYMQILYQNAFYAGSPTSSNSRYYGYGVRCIAK